MMLSVVNLETSNSLLGYISFSEISAYIFLLWRLIVQRFRLFLYYCDIVWS